MASILHKLERLAGTLVSQPWPLTGEQPSLAFYNSQCPLDAMDIKMKDTAVSGKHASRSKTGNECAHLRDRDLKLQGRHCGTVNQIATWYSHIPLSECQFKSQLLHVSNLGASYYVKMLGSLPFTR